MLSFALYFRCYSDPWKTVKTKKCSFTIADSISVLYAFHGMLYNPQE